MLTDLISAMSSRDNKKEPDQARDLVAEARRTRELRDQGYREQALKLFLPVCGRCCREFEGKKLLELTVHHKDHNHENNPSDGGNWELLRLYCHDNEHQKYLEAGSRDTTVPEGGREQPATHKPFANLKDLLKDKK